MNRNLGLWILDWSLNVEQFQHEDTKNNRQNQLRDNQGRSTKFHVNSDFKAIENEKTLNNNLIM